MGGQAGSFVEEAVSGQPTVTVTLVFVVVSTVDLTAEKSDHICRKQIEYPLKEWNLIDIERQNNSFELIYNHISVENYL